jgi:murein DD-endopeptidase MepM/ murein hydrolase activator NlpD
MLRKKINIIFLPDASNRVRQFKVPQSLLLGSLFVFLSVAILFIWGFAEYQDIKEKVPRLMQLEKENAQQKTQLASLTEKIDRINGRLIELNEFDQKLKIMVNLETDEENNQFLGIGGSDPSLLSPEYTIEKAHERLVTLMHQSLDDLDIAISVQINEKEELYKFLESQKNMLAHTPSVWPTRGWLSSGFGKRLSPFTKEEEFHKGIDISTRINTPILAPADGLVSSTGKDYLMGNKLMIDHGYGMKTRYGHMEKILVKRGEYVKRGQKIGLVGETGRTTGPHLHYEVYLNGLPVNPRHYILN